MIALNKGTMVCSLFRVGHGQLRRGGVGSGRAPRIQTTSPLAQLLCRTCLLAATLGLPILFAGNTHAESGGALAPFTTDGCSLFPNRAVVTPADWCGCCVAHDLAYWRGGTAEERLQADQQLRACVQRVTDSEALAELMFSGVRAGGGPYFFTTYRWGYGWSYGRGYAPLTTEERRRALVLEKEYFTTHPTAWCENSPGQPWLPKEWGGGHPLEPDTYR